MTLKKGKRENGTSLSRGHGGESGVLLWQSPERVTAWKLQVSGKNPPNAPTPTLLGRQILGIYYVLSIVIQPLCLALVMLFFGVVLVLQGLQATTFTAPEATQKLLRSKLNVRH